MNIFRFAQEIGRCWTELGDLREGTLECWSRLYFESGYSSRTERLPVRLPKQDIEYVVSQYRSFLDDVRSELVMFSEELAKPYFFAVTDMSGVTIDLLAPKWVLSRLRSHDIGIGTSFAMEHAGINAISVAMQLEETVCVTGAEHTVGLLREWTCICVPVYLQDRVYAYIDLSMLGDISPLLAAPLLEESVMAIQQRLLHSGAEAYASLARTHHVPASGF